MGWPSKAPFDGIIVTAAAAEIPAELLDQLGIGGRIVTPVCLGNEQVLKVIERTASGYNETVVERVKFVPLLSGVVC